MKGLIWSNGWQGWRGGWPSQTSMLTTRVSGYQQCMRQYQPTSFQPTNHTNQPTSFSGKLAIKTNIATSAGSCSTLTDPLWVDLIWVILPPPWGTCSGTCPGPSVRTLRGVFLEFPDKSYCHTRPERWRQKNIYLHIHKTQKVSIDECTTAYSDSFCMNVIIHGYLFFLLHTHTHKHKLHAHAKKSWWTTQK